MALRQKQNQGRVIPDKRGRRQKITIDEALSEVAEDLEDRTAEVHSQSGQGPEEREGDASVGVVPTRPTGNPSNRQRRNKRKVADNPTS